MKLPKNYFQIWLKKGNNTLKKIGICSVTFRKASVEEIIDLVKDSPLQAIEWGGDQHVPPFDLENAKKVGKQTREAGLEVSSYGSYYYAGLGESFDPYLKTAQVLGTDAIRIWAKRMDFKKEIGKIDEVEFQKVVADIKQAAQSAASLGISIHLEFHQGTYTDTTDSAKRLMKEINQPNVYLYWQPLAYLSIEERLVQIEELGSYISNIHVFQWDQDFNRFPLEEGKEEWLGYIKHIQDYSSNPHYFLLEFMKDNSVEQFEKDSVVFESMFK